MLAVVTSLFFLYNCDEDYVSSLNFINPTASLELITNLDDLYLGETVENLEIILKVKDAPSISYLDFSINYSPDFFTSDTMQVSINASLPHPFLFYDLLLCYYKEAIHQFSIYAYKFY